MSFLKNKGTFKRCESDPNSKVIRLYNKDSLVTISIIIGLAAALLLSFAGNSYFLLKDEDKGKQEPNVSVAPQNEPLTSEKTMKLQAEPNVFGEATASLTKKGGNLNVVIQANNLKNVKGNEVYQVWGIKGDTPHPAGAFVTDKNGNGTVVYMMSQKEQTEKWDVMAITLDECE
ncbi:MULTISPECIES: anti-sigma factor [Priestia]|uniref:anti-sigma factor n=1 Tax=Priestia TaxID=2800373 RepID=UPI0021ADD127|nr:MULTISPECIES: anti-sigma factor [Priestia]MCZ8495923.1 anti-sigma factor [Priestia megaterium]UYV54901.1 anti-sigma factor [Priestia megaterium]